MFRSLFDIVERQRDLREEDRIALLEQWKSQINNIMDETEENIKSWWNSIFYIDSQNGDNGNDGKSPSAPLKDLKSLSIPCGGQAVIYLMSDLEIDTDIRFPGAVLRFTKYSDKVNLLFKSKNYTNYESFFWIKADKISFSGVNLIADSTAATNNNSDTYNYMLDCNELVVISGDIDLGAKENVRLLRSYWSISTFLSVTLSVVNVNFDKSKGQKLIQLDTCRPQNLSLSLMGVNLPEGYEISDMISGIIRDENSKPRNVISNVIL